MPSSWKAVHISRMPAGILFVLAAAFAAAADACPSAGSVDSISAARSDIAHVSKVRWYGIETLDAGELKGGSLFSAGSELSDSLIGLELARIDSLCFSRGLLAAEAAIDTSIVGGAVEVGITISEGGRASIGGVTISGSEVVPREEIAGRLGVGAGSPFDPGALKRSMERLLEDLNRKGYPYAQVWMTGFEFDRKTNTVDLTFAVYGGEESRIGAVRFEGLARTDTSLALRLSRLDVGDLYDEKKVERARGYLSSSGLFTEVGVPTVGRMGPGAVEIEIPVGEAERANSVQGMFGFSKKDDGGYTTNGSVDLALCNLGGSGRDVRFRWLDDGNSYQTILLAYSERFFLSLPPDLGAELRQDVYDTLYDYTLVGFDLSMGVGPGSVLLAGYSWDNNIPQEDGILLRSVRHRFRLGLAAVFAGRSGAELRVEGALRKGYLEGGGESVDKQLLYRFEGHIEVPAFAGQTMFARIASEGVFSTGEVRPAETYPLGGARSLRGYRENQFRGERIAWSNLEYRFGGESRIFLFYDVGAYFREAEKWDVKTGLGFGLRSSSGLGTVELSFGVGDKLSLEGTRIHISLIENF